MADYKNMYKTLFVSISEAIDILQKAQIKAEEIYLESSDNKTKIFNDFKGFNDLEKTNEKLNQKNQ